MSSQTINKFETSKLLGFTMGYNSKNTVVLSARILFWPELVGLYGGNR